MTFLTTSFCLLSSEKTTSYRRTSSGGSSHVKSGVFSPTCVGSQEELYYSLLGSNQSLAPAPAQSTSSAVTGVPRSRKNAMVRSQRNVLLLLH